MNDFQENEETAELASDPAVKAVVQDVLRNGFVEGAQNKVLYENARRHLAAVNRALEPLDLHLRVDEIRGLLILEIAAAGDAEEAWRHPLVRRQRLTLEQSLLVAFLRRHYVVREQEGGIGAGQVLVAVEELVGEMKVFLGDSGSDRKNERRVMTLLENLCGHGLVSEIDQNMEVSVRPLIVYLANPESLEALIAQFRGLAEKGM